MTDKITNELLFEHLRRMQGDLSDIKVIMREMRSEFISLRQHDANLQQDHVLHEHRILALEDNVERINRRLDIQDNK